MIEIISDIRNKLQLPLSILEKLAKGETVDKRIAKQALSDLKKIVQTVGKLEKKKLNTNV